MEVVSAPQIPDRDTQSIRICVKYKKWARNCVNVSDAGSSSENKNTTDDIIPTPFGSGMGRTDGRIDLTVAMKM